MNAPAENQLTPFQRATQSIQRALSNEQFRGNLAKSMGVTPNDPVISRFERVTMLAVSSDPKLLSADRQSLFLACQAAANDRLMPDGKQGKLVVYSTKEGNQWVEKVQWQRMVGGLRVLAARAGYDLIAEPVYRNELFRHRKGSNPGIDHEPVALGDDPGDLVGYYCVATCSKGDFAGKQYFEVMTIAQVDKIKQRTKSKTKDGVIVGPWASDEVEMGRKTVAKRLFKSLPIYDGAEDVERFINNDNDEYEPYPTQSATQSAPSATATTSAQESTPAAAKRSSVLQGVVDAEGTDDAVIDGEATVVQEPESDPPHASRADPAHVSNPDDPF